MRPRPEPSPPWSFVAGVRRKEDLSTRHFIIGLERPPGFPDCSPGNFIHVGIPSTERFFLRRPLSIMDCDEREITLLILEKGEGTGVLRKLGPGDTLEFLGPLGNRFPDPVGRTLAVAGGVGLAPLYFLAKRVPGESVRLIYGARSEEELFLDGLDLAQVAERLATEDGSHGFRGTVVDLARVLLEEGEVDAVYSCGPAPMLAKLAQRTVSLGIPHHASLENRMACGIGVCRSCVIRIRNGSGKETNATVCRDGPVFDATSVVWEKLPPP